MNKKYFSQGTRIIACVLLAVIYISAFSGCDLLNVNKETTTGNTNDKTSVTTSTTTAEKETSVPTESTAQEQNETDNNVEEYNYVFSPAPDCEPSKFNIIWEVIKDGNKINDFISDKPILFPTSSEYTDVRGITSFRGNNWRDSAQYGELNINEHKLEEIWSSKTGYVNAMGFLWPGIGWTGQPAIIEWDDDLKQKMNIYPEKKVKEGLVEVICAALDGNIYFLDLDDGKPTRPAIEIGFSHKGSVMVDPRGYPLLYTGQGLQENNGKYGKIGYRIISLIDQQILYFLDGIDSSAYRKWGAFDSGGLIDEETDTLIIAGENGILYQIKLNTAYDETSGNISVNPEVVRGRYNLSYSEALGMSSYTYGFECSPSAFGNYIFLSDNSGLMQCIDLNTLKPVWARYLIDDSDSSPALEVNGPDVSIYTACEIDFQKANGYSYIRKLNALSGELIWENTYKCAYNSVNNVGTLSTPVIGKNDIEDIVVYAVAIDSYNKNGGLLVALDKQTGEEVWSIIMDFYSWSSPTAVYDNEGKSYIIFCDAGGYMYLIEGTTGEIFDKLPLRGNIEASPAIFGNTIVIGTKGQEIIGVKIR